MWPLLNTLFPGTKQMATEPSLQGDPGGRETSEEQKSTESGHPTCHKEVSPATSGFYQAWMAARLQRLGFLRCSKPSVRMVPRCPLLIHFRDEEALREEHLPRKAIEMCTGAKPGSCSLHEALPSVDSS